MQENTNNTQPVMEGDVPPNFQGRQSFPPMGFWKLAISLFIYPRLALLNARVHKLWGKAFLMLFLTACITSGFISSKHAPLLHREIHGMYDLIVTELGELTFDEEQNKLGWTRELNLPLTKARGQWQLDVTESLEDFQADQANEASQDKGIVIARDGLKPWLKLPEAEILMVPMTTEQQEFKDLFMTVGHQRDGIYVLEERHLRKLEETTDIVTTVFLTITTAVSSLRMLLTCVFIFVLMSVLFNRGERASVGAIIASSMTCTFPPFLLTMATAALPGINFAINTLFTIFFVVYLVVIVLDKSVVIRRIKRD